MLFLAHFKKQVYLCGVNQRLAVTFNYLFHFLILTIMAKSFIESINEVKNSNMSYNKKREELIKMGVRTNEIVLVLGKRPAVQNPGSRSFAFTFGVELETIGINRDSAINEASNNGLRLEEQGYNHTDSHEIYKFVHDGSLQGENAIECVTPVLSSKGGFKSLETLCKVLNNNGARVNKSCGTHVHVGCDGMTDEWYANVFYNYQCLESLIDSFMAESRRGNVSNWCRTLADHNLADCNTIDGVRRELSSDRYHKVNPCAWARHRTIEFRQHQGTTDYEKISNWVSFVGKLVGWSKANRFNGAVNSLADVPFINAKEKAFFKARIEHFANH